MASAAEALAEAPAAVLPVPAPAAEAGPQLNSEEQDAESGNYRADNKMTIVCVGDLEGTSLEKIFDPTCHNPRSQTNVLTPTSSKLTELYAYFTVRQDGTLSLRENVILVYLGDVFGDGPNNIELATTLLKLKKDNPTRVILITGNRDINKFRLGWELQPTTACMEELERRVKDFLRGNHGAFDMFEFKFERNDPADFDYLWKDTGKDFKKKFSSDEHKINIASMIRCKDRVTYVVEITMTEKCAWKFLVDEYLTKHGFTPEQLKSSISDEVKSYIYAYLVQAMSGNIECHGYSEFNNIFEELLMAGHLMACIVTPDRG